MSRVLLWTTDLSAAFQPFHVSVLVADLELQEPAWQAMVHATSPLATTTPIWSLRITTTAMKILESAAQTTMSGVLAGLARKTTVPLPA